MLSPAEQVLHRGVRVEPLHASERLMQVFRRNEIRLLDVVVKKIVLPVLVLEALVALLMMLVILMQRPKSEGLGAAFGGGVTENIFGAQTTNVLVKFTSWLAGIFFALTFALSILYAHRSTADSAFRRELMKSQAAPQTSPAPASSIKSSVWPPIREDDDSMS